MHFVPKNVGCHVNGPHVIWDKLNGDGYVSVSLWTLITNNCVKLIDLSCSFTDYDTSDPDRKLFLLEIWSRMLVKTSNITPLTMKIGWNLQSDLCCDPWSMKNSSEFTWYYGSGLLFLSTLDNWRQAPHTKSNNTALYRTTNFLYCKGFVMLCKQSWMGSQSDYLAATALVWSCIKRVISTQVPWMWKIF